LSFELLLYKAKKMALRIGVIGAGHFGKYHIQALKNYKDVEFVGFYDINPMVQQSVSSEFNVKSYKSYEGNTIM
jgi:predicted dehydrogenase